jgi:hypothetical protein
MFSSRILDVDTKTGVSKLLDVRSVIVSVLRLPHVQMNQPIYIQRTLSASSSL